MSGGTSTLTSFTRGENPLRADKLNTAFSERVSRAGDVMEGLLTLVGDPIGSFDAATKQYVDRLYAVGLPPGGPYLPLSGGTIQGAQNDLLTVLNTSTANPIVPGYAMSARFGAFTAVDIFGMCLNVPPRNTFNVLEGVLTLPATVTTTNTYHTAVSGFSYNQSATSVGYGVGGYAVAAADFVQTGAIGSVAVDSPHTRGGYTGVRLQNEHDFYTNDPGSSVRGALHDGYFRQAPNSGQNYVGYNVNLFDGGTAIASASFNGSVMTIDQVTSGTFSPGMRLQATGVDGTANIIILSFGTATGGVGTYNIGLSDGTPASVGVIASTNNGQGVRGSGAGIVVNASVNGTVMTVNSVTSGVLAMGMFLQIGASTARLISFGTGTGGVGTYNISPDLGVVASTTVRGGSGSFVWNTAFQAPDGSCAVALDIGQRNFASTLTLGSKSQLMQWRYTDTVTAGGTGRIMQQWVEPTANGGVLRLRNFITGMPASYGVENWNTAASAFMGRNAAHTDWIDMLHVEANNRVVVGYGSSSITELCTSQGVQVEILDRGVASTNSIGMIGATASSSARIYMIGGGNLQFANVARLVGDTNGFISPWPVVNGVPTGIPVNVDLSNAYAIFNAQSKTLNIFDPLSNAWRSIPTNVGAA